jgi:hypothetical protein
MQPLTLSLERPAEVLEVVEELLLGNSYRGRELLERGGSIAERPMEGLAHSLASFDRWARPTWRGSAIVAPSRHGPRMLAVVRTSKRGTEASWLTLRH